MPCDGKTGLGHGYRQQELTTGTGLDDKAIEDKISTLVKEGAK